MFTLRNTPVTPPITTHYFRSVFVRVFLVLLVFSFAIPPLSANAQYSSRKKSVRRLIIDLDHEYRRLDEDIRKLDEFVHGFPGMMLHLTVKTKMADARLISLEVTDRRKPVSSHLYSPYENEAMDAGGRHDFYRGEVSEGVHELKVVYYWAEGEKPAQKGEAVVLVTVRPAKSYFIELSLEKKRGKQVELRANEFEFVGQ